MAAGNTLTTGISDTIEERLSDGIRESLPRLDPVWKQFHDTYSSVTREGIGRDWTVIHTFNESLSGAFKWVSARGSSIDNSTLTHSLIPSAVREYPNLQDTTLPGYVQKKIVLVEGLGNLFVPQQYLRASKLEAAIGDVVLDIVRGSAQLTALSDIQCFYNVNADKAVIAEIADVSIGSDPDDDTATLGIWGAIGMFYNGMHVDVYKDSSGELGAQWNTTYQCVVDGVRYVPESNDAGYGEIKLVRKDGGTIDTFVAGDFITVFESVSADGATQYGPTGPNQWLTATSTDIFNLDVTSSQQFQSVVQSSVGDLDEAKMNQYFSRLWKAYGTMNFPDCVITSMGVTTALIDTSYGLAERFNRNLGERNKLAMGFEEPGASAYMFNGIPIKWFQSPYMPSSSAFNGTQNGGRLWAFKTRDNNIRRYLPPPLPGAKRHSQFGSEVEFLFGGDGADGIFSAMHSSTGRKTEWREAPFNRFVEYCPVYMQGLNLSGITETL